jgi:hypothetical protein
MYFLYTCIFLYIHVYSRVKQMSAITYGKRNKIPTSTLGIFTLPIPTSTDDVRFVQPLTGLKHDLKSLASPIKQTPAISIKKSPTRKRKSPIKKSPTRKRIKTKTPQTSDKDDTFEHIKTKTPIKKSPTRKTSSEDKAAAEAESIKKKQLEEEKKLSPIDFEQEDADKILDLITTNTDQQGIDNAMSKMRPEDMRKMIRFATNYKKIPTRVQRDFLSNIDSKIKTENPQTRMIYEETRPVAEEKINWTSKKSTLPRGVIVLAHTHGGFVHSRDLIKYPTDTLESVSTLYLSDIGSAVCNTRQDYKKFDNEFIRSFQEGFSIKDISEKVQEISNKSKLGLKNIDFNKKRTDESILERYFESGVYNLAVSTKTKTNNIPFLNKSYSCGPSQNGYPYHSIQVVDYDDFVYLLPKTYGLRPLSDYKSNFDCKTADSSITTLELVDELSKAIPNLKHVLIIDTSCSTFTPSIIKLLFKEMPPNLTPHKHRKTGLFKKIDWDKVKGKHKYYQEIQTELEKMLTRPLFSGGGKKTKKRQHGSRYKKTKKN